MGRVEDSEVNLKTHVRKVLSGVDGYPLVEIHWLDAVATAIDWEEKPNTKPMPTVSVGYLIESNSDSMTLVAIVNETHVGHGLTIPAGCITKVVKLVRETGSWPEIQ